MTERIYTRGQSGRLEHLQEEPFSSENELQTLIAEHPELLDGEQIRPGDPRRWILITPEKGISETSDSGARWAIDHLIVDQDAVPTLVEVKRGSNPEIRRTVVGQMLEYAAHAALNWTAEELRNAFEDTSQRRNRNPDEILGQLLEVEGEPDADGFWDQVATNLAARRLRLLFVADHIPDSLTRVVEFLNSQMRQIEVLAVEIKQFRGGSVQTLVPRVLGRSADAASQRKTPTRNRLTPTLFLDGFVNEEAKNAAGRLLETAKEAGAACEWGPSGVSVRARCSRWTQPITVAWLYPESMRDKGWMRTRDFTFGTHILGSRDPGPDDELRAILEKWVECFRDDAFTSRAHSKGVDAWSVDYEDAVNHIELLTDRLSGILSELVSLPAAFTGSKVGTG